MPKITKRSVDALHPGTADLLLWDTELRGFGLRCRPSGIKTYVLKYRTASGCQRWHTIGQHGNPWTPEMARINALQLKAEVSQGADPAEAKRRRRRERTIAELADRYLAEHVAAHNKPSTAIEVRRIVERRIKPHLGHIKITELSRAQVKAWHQGMSDTPYEANRALAYCSKMLSLAAREWELRADNPCTGLQRFPERARERYFSDDELGRIGEILYRMEQNGSELPGFVLLVRLLATTGMRLGEVLGIKWADVDIAGRVIPLRDAKAGARVVRLGVGTAAVLERTHQEGSYVVHGLDPDQPLSVSVAEKAWQRLRDAAKLGDGRIHDLRHTVGTLAALSGANAFAVRDLLGHKTLAMTGRYVARAADLVSATADAVSSRVAAAFEGSGASGAEIVTLATRRVTIGS
jgi:integrase